MTTAYPGGIDNFTNPTSTDTLSSATVPHASEHANANDAIKAIETELGTNPKGSYSNVAARLAASTGSITTWRKAAAGGETSLSGTDDFSTTLAYTVGQEQVFINGVLLERGVDYTATTGSSITGLTALVASDIATVISVGTFNVANAIPLSTVTAKGDTLVATGSATITNLPVGSNDQILVADSTQSTGMAWKSYGAQQVAGKNAIINGGMDIWARGTSVSLAASTSYTSGYTADRWNTSTGANQATTISRQATSDTTNLPNIQYCARFQRNSGQTGTTTYTLTNNFESVNSISFAGKTVTYSFYARAGSNYSATSNALTVILFTGTGTDQNVQSGYTGQISAISQTATLTTTWQRFQYTTTLGTSITQIGTSFQFAPTGTAGANDYFEITGVQLELGSTATPFSRAGGSIGGELALCQRYYKRNTASDPYSIMANGNADSTTTFVAFVYHNPPLRVAPTSVDWGNLAIYSFGEGPNTISTLTLASGAQSQNASQLSITGLTSAVVTRFGALRANNSSSGYLGFSAEL